MTDALAWTLIGVAPGQAFAVADVEGQGRITIRPSVEGASCHVEFVTLDPSVGGRIGSVATREDGQALFDWVGSAEVEGTAEEILAAAGFETQWVVDGWAGPTTVMGRRSRGGAYHAQVSGRHVRIAYERRGDCGVRDLLTLSTAAPSPAGDGVREVAVPERFKDVAGFAAMAVEMMRRDETARTSA